MANTKKLRSRIKSVKNTSQITKAMQMVAATKMRRAQSQALSGRPYDSTLESALAKLSRNVEPELSPLLGGMDSRFRGNDKGGSNVGVLLLTTDKSLCGALNTNVFRAILIDSRFRGNDIFYTVGKKGRNFVVKLGRKLEADFENPEIVTFRQAKQITKLLTKSFLSDQLSEVFLVYPNFVSTLKQEPKIVKLLPIDPNSISSSVTLSETKGIYSSAVPQNDKQKTHGIHDTSEFIFEPNSNDLLDFVLNHQIETKIYQALLETKASEHSARMIAMQNATDNAKELVGDLTLSYNQIRQSAITNELLEITTAQSALE